ncbi:MAG: ABC transporter substrate-binding protein [Hungatella hathewayi]|nr:ABC transporter substrate-binding protein [Hungatella hathewayi]
MKKQTLAALMACAVTAAALMGCSTKTAETAPETTVASETTAAPETTQEETTTAEVSTEAPGTSSGMTLKVGSLKGPTSMGLVSLMDQASKGEAKGNYEFTMVTAADELLTKVISGDLDIALVPANMASILYNKTNHGVNVIDINTLGVLYVVSSDESIQSVADLKGKTLYMTGKGTTPDYVLQYLLSENGLTTDDVTIEYKSEATEVAAVLKEQEGAIGLLPQPFVTVAMAQNESLKMVLDLTKEWEAIQGGTGGSLVTGVTICRSELFADPAGAEAIDVFLAEHKASAMFAIDNVAETADLVAAAGIIEKAPVAAKAIPYCSITFVDGEMMKSMLDGYLTVLFDQDPASVGGTLPDDAFYYIP